MPSEAEIRSYYEAALAALRFVDVQSNGGRFGKDADIRWKGFRGHLQDVDRIDVLLRDADARWPGSMGARRVFNRQGVSENDAFGKGWSPLDPVAGADLWREVSGAKPPPALADALANMAAVWKLPLSSHKPAPVQPSSRLVTAGASAVVALAQSFVGRDDLNWAQQVVVVASDPATRQLAAFCGAALNVTNAMPVLLAVNEPGDFKGYAIEVSSDAAPGDASWAKQVVS